MLRNDLTSLTLAELSLVLLFLVIVVIYASDNINANTESLDTDILTKKYNDVVEVNSNYKKRIEILENSFNTIKQENINLKNNLDEVNSKLDIMDSLKNDYSRLEIKFTDASLNLKKCQSLKGYSDNIKEANVIIKDNNELIEKLEKENLSLKSHLAEFKQELDKIIQKNIDNSKLSSKQTPSCKEIGINRDFLATITILDENLFLIDEKELNYSQLTNYLEADLDLARRNKCIQMVKAFASNTVSAQQYDIALKKLEQLFYIKRLGFK